MAAYHGKRGKLYLSTTGTGNAASVAIVDWDLAYGNDADDATTTDNANKVYVMGLPDPELSGTFVWDDTVDTMFTAQASTDGVKFYVYPSRDVPTKYWYGTAWFSVDNVAGGVDGAVKGSWKLIPKGDWSRQ